MSLLPINSRTAQVAGLLAASFGVPYAYHNLGTHSNPGPSATSSNTMWGGKLVSTQSSPTAFENVAVTNPTLRDLRQFVRFDITPGWVTNTFPRVGTVLSNVQMDGLRAPVVTGTSATDFAGTVDFYFDRMQQPRRIILQGHCGDPSVLASLLLQSYNLQPEPALGGHLYVNRWNNRVTSVAMFQPAPIIYAQDPYQKFSVFIEVNQPSMEYGLSETAEQILRNSWQNLRWQ